MIFRYIWLETSEIAHRTSEIKRLPRIHEFFKDYSLLITHNSTLQLTSFFYILAPNSTTA